MAETRKRKGGGSKLVRTETVTVRLDPKLRYLAELAARKQRRTLSSYIEWAVEDSLERVNIAYDPALNLTLTIAGVSHKLWDVEESERFAKLALYYPDLLTHEEQIIWKIVSENGYFWNGSYSSSNDYVYTWNTNNIACLVLDRLQEYWDLVIAVARREAVKDELPTWVKQRRPLHRPKATTAPATFPTPDEPEPDVSDVPEDDIPY